MVLCKDCGEQNEEGSPFCVRCGVFLEWEGERTKTPAGAAVSEGAQTENADSALPGPPGGLRVGPDFTTADPKEGDLAPLPAPGEAPDPVSGRPSVRRGIARPAKSAAAAPAGSQICGGCGMPNQPTRRFCAKCGFSLVDAKLIRKAAWWRRALGREQVYAAGTRIRPGTGRRKFRGATRLGVVLALVAGAGILAGPQRGLVERGIHFVQNKAAGPIQVRLVTPKASGVSGKQSAQLAFDGAKNTFWAAPRAGRGATAVPYLTGSFAAPVKLVAFGIYPGVSEETPKFVAGPRPAEIEVTVTTGTGPVVKRFPLEDVPKSQQFDFAVNDARSIQVAVIRSKAPSRTVLTAIAELEFFANR
ncbi:MAG TPA: zinc ribbon domain-containing protein [Kribbella sp.]